jgi:pSer/pThr/pTyr-binding forkhead associated (FHA) protein
LWRVSAYDRAGKQVATVDLVQGEVTIGREADRQLVLPSASVSRRHAKVVIQGGQPCILDEGSSNGVIINGVRIAAPTAVGPTTQVDVAEFRLTIEPLTQTEGVAPLPPPSAQPASDGLRLIGENGTYAGREFPLPMGTLTVGRAADNDVVFDDPSLSRKHSRLHRSPGAIDVEDLGSSNGTYVNGRRVGRGNAGVGDTVRFGDLSFKVVGDKPAGRGAGPAVARGGGAGTGTESVDNPTANLIVVIMGGVTLILIILGIVFLFKKPPTVPANGREAIAKLMKQANDHLEAGRSLYKAKKYGEAKEELEQAIDLDPANVEARKLRLAAVHGADDDRLVQSATANLKLGDRRGIESAIKTLSEISEGSTARETLLSRIPPALVELGQDSFSKKAYADSAWAICKAYQLAPAGSDARPDARAQRTLREAEKKLKKDKSYVPCRI